MSSPETEGGGGLAPEQYELHALARPVEAVSRRAFLKSVGAGLIVVAIAGKISAQAESGANGRRASRQRRPAEIDAWLHIAEDGTVTFFTGKAEVGQNIRTLLTQIVVEELPLPLSAISLPLAAMTPPDPKPACAHFSVPVESSRHLRLAVVVVSPSTP